MAQISYAEFSGLLEKSQLLTAAQLEEVAQSYGSQPPVRIAEMLVSQKWITRWQARELLEGRARFTLGRFRILEKLGQGGMGAVFKAQEQAGMKRTVAIKVMAGKFLKNADAEKRFLREVQAAASLQHPNIVTAYDADQEGKTHFLVMEYVAGRDLSSWVKKLGRLPIDFGCECIRQAALGLDHAHQSGLIHRDIKPSNLLVIAKDTSEKPTIKVMDFGLARFTAGETQRTELTNTGQILGTIDYIAPEQAKNTKYADKRSDIFSLGCALFKVLTGEVPYPGENATEQLFARASNSARSARSFREEIPEQLEAVISTMLSPDPNDRYQSAAEVAEVLAPFSLGGEPSTFFASDLPTGGIIDMGDTKSFANDQISDPSIDPGGELGGDQSPQIVADASTKTMMRSRTEFKRPNKKSPWLIPSIAGAGALLLVLFLWTLFQPAENTQANASNSSSTQQPANDFQTNSPNRPSTNPRTQPITPDTNSSTNNTSANGTDLTSDTKRVLMVVPYSGFYYGDYEPIRTPLEAAGYQVTVASSQSGRARESGGGGRTASVDLLLRNARASDYDAVFFVGAPNPETNMEFIGDNPNARDAQRVINEMLRQDKYVASLCVGSAVLGDAGALRNLRVANVTHIPNRIKQRSGATAWEERPVLRTSDNILTGGDSQFAPAFVEAFLRLLRED